jgi:predicted transglutaminase-like cysteine proteinase
MKKLIIIFLLLTLATGCASLHKRGYRPVDRTADYNTFVLSTKQMTEREKVFKTNDFFNTFLYATDDVVYKQKDYWASPKETIQRGAGDCEDFAFAKYFTLLKVGVAPSKIRLAYVKLDGNAHMVALYEDIDGSFLVLDNFDLDIKPLAKRKDIEMFYTFNSQYVWAADLNKPASVNKMSLWKDLMTRIGALV